MGKEGNLSDFLLILQMKQGNEKAFDKFVRKYYAEIIYQKADHTKKNMGLTTWRNSPDGRILKSDVMIAKNYLEEKQIKRLERAVTGYFDYIEDLVERENTFTMEEFSKSVNEFLEFRKYDILKDNGKISRKQAEEKAEKAASSSGRRPPSCSRAWCSR